jgi:choline monooxygenase
MPPNEIYYDSDFSKVENRPGGIFRKFWTYVGHTGQFSADGEGKYISATLGQNLPIIITQAHDESFLGFVNICRHRAAVMIQSTGAESMGTCGFFGKHIICPYHGWQYAADGRLAKAVKMKGVEGFSARDHSLLPVHVDRIGHLLFARDPSSPISAPKDVSLNSSGESGGSEVATLDEAYPGLREQLGELDKRGGYKFVARHSYDIGCNWKVFADNYLDGG